jgi:hypothetical protein
MPAADRKAIKRVIDALEEFGLDLSGLEDVDDLETFASLVECAARNHGPMDGYEDGDERPDGVRMSLRASDIASHARRLCSKVNNRYRNSVLGKRKLKRKKRLRMSLTANKPMTEAEPSALAASFIHHVYGDGDGGGADSFLRHCGYDIPRN